MFAWAVEFEQFPRYHPAFIKTTKHGLSCLNLRGEAMPCRSRGLNGQWVKETGCLFHCCSALDQISVFFAEFHAYRISCFDERLLVDIGNNLNALLSQLVQ